MVWPFRFVMFYWRRFLQKRARPGAGEMCTFARQVEVAPDDVITQTVFEAVESGKIGGNCANYDIVPFKHNFEREYMALLSQAVERGETEKPLPAPFDELGWPLGWPDKVDDGNAGFPCRRRHTLVHFLRST
eukprot:6975210-Prymnesium_polylepis.1